MSNCTVEIPDKGYASGQEMLNWAKAYCPSLITNDARCNAIEYGMTMYEPEGFVRIYYFGNERDATLFRLRWA